MRQLTLTPRLQSAADLVPNKARLADVGTDHAYLPAYLLQRGLAVYAVASDVRPGPLERARQTAVRWGLTDRMDFRLCDGLLGIAPGEVDAVAVAGMGGETIASILEAAPWLKSRGCTLVLQPMSAQEDLRQWLAENGYRIEREVLSLEGETLYVAFLVTAGEMGSMTPAELWAGRQTREDPLRGRCLARLLNKTERAICGLRRSTQASSRLKLAHLEEVQAGLRQMWEEWQTWQK